MQKSIDYGILECVNKSLNVTKKTYTFFSLVDTHLTFSICCLWHLCKYMPEIVKQNCYFSDNFNQISDRKEPKLWKKHWKVQAMKTLKHPWDSSLHLLLDGKMMVYFRDLFLCVILFRMLHTNKC